MPIEFEEDVRPELAVEKASYRNPDAHADNLRLAESQNLTVDMVEDDLAETQRRQRLKDMRLDEIKAEHPSLTKYLSDEDNASISFDDIHNLGNLEDVVTRNRDALDIGTDTLVDVAAGVVTHGESILGIADILTFNAAGDALGAIGYNANQTRQALSEYYSYTRKRLDRKIANAEGFVDTFGELATSPSAAFGKLVQMAPMLLGITGAARATAVRLMRKERIDPSNAALVAEFVKRPEVKKKLVLASAVAEGAMSAGSIQEAARAEGRAWGESVVPAVMGGAGTALISNISSKFLPDVDEAELAVADMAKAGKDTIFAAGKEIVKGTIREGVIEELPQSAQEQVWTNLALGKPWNEGVPEAAAEGLVIGAGMGAGMSSTSQVIALMNRSERQVRSAVASLQEQDAIDQIISYAQSSTTRERAGDRFENFIDTLGPNREVLVPADVAQELEGAPEYITGQIDGLGGDVAIPLRKFASEIAVNDEWMNIVRPHIKLSAGSLSQTELDAGDTTEMQALLKKAQESQEILTEAEQVFDTVREQLVATRMQSEITARHSAALYPAAATVYVEKARKLGHDVTVGQMFEMMGFRVEAAVAPEIAPEPGVMLNQSRRDALSSADPENVRESSDEFVDWMDSESIVHDLETVASTGSQYYTVTKPSGITDQDGDDIPMVIKVRLSDHGRHYPGSDINIAPGITSLVDAAAMIKNARVKDGYKYDPEDTIGAIEGEDIDFGDAGEVLAQRQTREPRDLIVQHNLSLENLQFADKVGGLAAPSVAVTKRGIPMESFGEISLVGGPDMVDPKLSESAYLFDADIYSPRYPRMKLKINDSALYKLWDEFAEASDALGGGRLSVELDADEIAREGTSAFYNSPIAIHTYLKESGKRLPKIKYKEKPKVDKRLVDFVKAKRERAPATVHEVNGKFRIKFENQWYGKDHDTREQAEDLARDLTQDAQTIYPNVIMHDEEFQQLVKQVEIDELAPVKDEPFYDDMIQDIEDADVSTLAWRRAKKIQASLRPPEVDHYAMRDALRKKVDKDPEFDKWAQSKIDQISKGEVIPVESRTGNIRWVPHTLDNVVAEMTKKIRDGEGFNYGIGNIRATAAKQFRSIDAVRKDKDRLITSEQMGEVKDEIGNEFNELVDELRFYYKYDSEHFGYMNAVAENFADAVRGRGLPDFKGVPLELRDRVTEFLNKLKNADTEYFEGKFTRAVGIDEFSGAVVPRGKRYEPAVEILKKNGITNIRRYSLRKEGDYVRAMAGGFPREYFQSAAPQTFYSAVERVVETAKQPKATPDQWKALLKKTPGVRKEELVWLDIDSFLEGKKSVMQDDLLEYIRANTLQIDEKVKGEPSEDEIDAFLADETGEGFTREDAVEYLRGEEGRPEYADDDYNLLGGENYREVLFKMPVTQPLPEGFVVKPMMGGYVVFDREGSQRGATYTTEESARQDVARLTDVPPVTHQGAHFSGETNILAWVRLDDRVDANGDRVLFVQEIQSDWHQEGRKTGYGEPTKAEIDEAVSRLKKDRWELEETVLDPSKPSADPANKGYKIHRFWSEFGPAKPTEEEAWQAGAIFKLLSGKRLPDAPLKKTWHEMAFRRVMQMAAEQGYDRVAWTTGEQQVDRYDLSKHISSLTADEYEIAGDRQWRVKAEDLNGDPVRLPDDYLTDSELEEHVGKDLAEKIIEDGGGEYSGLDLKVGGEGMIGFYDKMIPAYAKEFGKKLDAKVEKTKVLTRTMEQRDADVDLLAELDAVPPGVEKGMQPVAEVLSLPVTDKMRETLPSGVAMFQAEDEIRAFIQFTEDNESIIRLTRASDLSSFLHESGHLFLEMERRFAEQYGVTDEMQALFDFLGVTGFDEITVEHHEKFAETFEVYLREGKAPSLKLRDAFAAFRRWLTVIYRRLTDPRLARAELTPEIREYMDRLLATEAEIEEAATNPAYDQYFRSKEQAGMSDEKWEQYQKQAQRVKDTATATLDEKVIAELQKRKTREWAAEREPLIAEERERLSQEPVYQALEITDEIPMDRALLKEAAGIDKIPPQLRGKTVTDGTGIDPIEVSEGYGFDSVKTMVEAMISVPNIKKAALDAAEERMVEKYGDMLNDGRIELEAREAMHNEEQAKLLLQELRALNRKVGDPSKKINREYLKAEAKAYIGGMKYRDIKPYKFYNNEIKAAKRVATAETDQERMAARIQQIANHYLFKEATEARAAMERHRKQVRGFETREYSTNTVAASYIQNIRMFAKSYNMRQGEAGRSLNIERVVSWMMTQLNDPNNYIDLDIIDPLILKMVTDHQNGLPVTYELPSFDDLTADELKGVVDQLRHMRYVGGKLSDETKAALMVTRETAAESITEFSNKVISPTHERNRTRETKEQILEFGYSHRRIGGILETLDGFEEGGPMGVEYERITAASDEELDLTSSMAESMGDAFKDVTELITKWKKTTITKEDGVDFTLSHRARFVLGLNWGNESNRSVLLEGLNNKFPDSYTEGDILKMLSTMSNAEIEALNKVWAAKEELWPKMSAVEVRRKGVAPRKIEASPFKLNGIQLTGGHYRLHYLRDPDDTARTEITVDRSASNDIKVGTASSMHERVGSGGRQVDLELSHLFQDIQEEIHYIAFAELSDHLNVMFRGVNNPVVNSIMVGYGEKYYDNVVTTLSTLTQPEDPVKGLWKGLRFVRSNLTYAFLAGSVRNVIQQPIAITNAISQLGEKYVLKGMFEFYRNPVGNWNKISEIEPFMKNRTALVNREAREQLLKIDSIHPKLGAMKNLAFLPQTFMDSLIAYPTWMGAVSKYKAEHPNADEKKARAYASDMVAKTIGSGLPKDVGSILNKGEAEKQITFMGTFFNLTWNLHVENAQLLKRGKINPMEYARRLGWMAIAPALIGIWLLDDTPDDDEELVAHALKEIGYYNMSSVFLVRDIASSMDGFSPSIPGLKFADGIVRVGRETRDLIIGDEEADANTIASIIRGVQPLVPLPMSGQAARTIEGVSDPGQSAWGALVEGRERN